MSQDTDRQAHSEVQIDNDSIRVTRWRFAPGQETGTHRHEWDYVVVPVTDGKVRIADAAGSRISEMHLGASYARPAGVEHNVINAGDGELSFVEIEMKERGGSAEPRL